MERIDGNREFAVEPVAAEAGNCDLFLSLTPWLSQSLKKLTHKLRPKMSVGFWDSFDVSLPLDFSKHSSELAFDLVRYVAPDSRWERFTRPLTYPAHARQVAQSVRDTVGPRRTMTLHMDTLAEKMWPTERFASVLHTFLQRHADFIVLLIGMKDCGIENHINSNRLIPLLRLDLPSTWCIISMSDFFLGVDSCFLHAADFAYVPSVGMFGPTAHMEFGFKLAPNITIQAQSRMDDIEVDHVLSALESIVACRRSRGYSWLENEAETPAYFAVTFHRLVATFPFSTSRVVEGGGGMDMYRSLGGKEAGNQSHQKDQ
jgi:ADP-heptose:LPS heptosyltransferase